MARGQKHYTEEFKNTTITASDYQTMLKKMAKLEFMHYKIPLNIECEYFSK